MFNRSGGRKYLNENERLKLLAVITAEPDTGVRAFALTLFYTGCRISEGIRLSVERVDAANRTLVFETLKRRKKGHFREVPIPDVLCVLVQSLLDEQDGSARVWPYSRTTAYRHVKGLMKKAAIEGSMACPKGLRHGMAVACLARGIPLTTVQKWLGHARLETTGIYLNVGGVEERQLASRLWATVEGVNAPENGLPSPDSGAGSG